MADFVADSLYNDIDGLTRLLQELEPKQRKGFMELIREIVKKITDKLKGVDKTLEGQLAKLEKEYAKLLGESTKVAKNEKTTEKGGKYDTNDIIDLSKDNELSKRIGNLTGAPKYKIIQQYILEVLGGQPITMSDGRKVVVKQNDAKHIAHGAWDKKTAQISEIKKLVEKAKLYAEELNPEHDVFDYFCYYKANVRYNNKEFPIFLNVGRAKNNEGYRLYDITNKIRDTADRINGLGRPGGYALTNGISNKNIPQTKQSVNKKLSISPATNAEYMSAVENGDVLFHNILHKKRITVQRYPYIFI